MAINITQPAACINIGSPFFGSEPFRGFECITDYIVELTEQVSTISITNTQSALQTPMTAVAALAIIIVAYSTLIGGESNIRKPLLQIGVIGLTVVMFNWFPQHAMDDVKRLLIQYPSNLGVAITGQNVPQSSPAGGTLQTQIPAHLDQIFAKSLRIAWTIGLESTAGAAAQRVGAGAKPDNCATGTQEGRWTMLSRIKNIALGTVKGILHLFMALVIIFTVAVWSTNAAMMFITNYLRAAILLFLAPLFFLLFMFNKTRDISMKWTQSLISVFVLNLLLTILLSLSTLMTGALIGYVWDETSCDIEPFKASVLITLIFCVLYSMTKNIPTIAQELTGSSGQSGAEIIGQAMKFGMQGAGTAAIAGKLSYQGAASTYRGYKRWDNAVFGPANHDEAKRHEETKRHDFRNRGSDDGGGTMSKPPPSQNRQE